MVRGFWLEAVLAWAAAAKQKRAEEQARLREQERAQKRQAVERAAQQKRNARAAAQAARREGVPVDAKPVDAPAS